MTAFSWNSCWLIWTVLPNMYRQTKFSTLSRRCSSIWYNRLSILVTSLWSSKKFLWLFLCHMPSQYRPTHTIQLVFWRPRDPVKCPWSVLGYRPTVRLVQLDGILPSIRVQGHARYRTRRDRWALSGYNGNLLRLSRNVWCEHGSSTQGCGSMLDRARTNQNVLPIMSSPVAANISADLWLYNLHGYWMSRRYELTAILLLMSSKRSW